MSLYVCMYPCVYYIYMFCWPWACMYVCIHVYIHTHLASTHMQYIHAYIHTCTHTQGIPPFAGDSDEESFALSLRGHYDKRVSACTQCVGLACIETCLTKPFVHAHMYILRTHLNFRVTVHMTTFFHFSASERNHICMHTRICVHVLRLTHCMALYVTVFLFSAFGWHFGCCKGFGSQDADVQSCEGMLMLFWHKYCAVYYHTII